MAEVLLVSKPVVPPWNDSSKNLVRDLAGALRGHIPHVMVTAGTYPSLGAAVPEPIYPPVAAGFAPAWTDNARVLLRLLTGPRRALWHFFFAPNPRSSVAARAVSGLRRVPTVQTVCSVPRCSDGLSRVLFADRVVVLSRHTERRFRAEGVSEGRLRRIAPSITPPVPSTLGRYALRTKLGLPVSAPLLVFPGDLEFGGGGARCLQLLDALRADCDPVLVLACRDKTPAAAGARRALQARAAQMGLGERARFLGETPDIHLLLQAADVVLLPSDSTYAKMDLPLVLIEAMALCRPVVVAQGTPAEELAEGGAAVRSDLHPDALASAVGLLLGDARSRDALGERAAAAAAQYLPPRMAAQYAELYDELLAG